MKQKIVFPDYNNCILNLVTSILKKYNVKTKYNTLEKIDKLLEKNYDNVVLVILDGMGKNIIENNSPNGIFIKNQIDTITSICPATTTAAITTYYSGKPPIETGYIAWTQYFKEYGKVINILRKEDTYTGEHFEIQNMKIEDMLKYKNICEQIRENSPKIKTFDIMPSYCEKMSEVKIVSENIEEMCQGIETLCKNSDKKFIIAYNDKPDGLIHKYGCYSEETKEFIIKAEKEISKMLKEIENTNTLVILSADHGHIDIKETIDLLEMKEIQECLIMPPTFEARMLTLWVKQDMKNEFEERFNEKFKDKFILYSKKEFLEKGFLGYGDKHKKIDDFIGDYIAIAISDTRILLDNYLSREKIGIKEKKATHCGLTKDEMEVPLIIFETDKRR